MPPVLFPRVVSPSWSIVLSALMIVAGLCAIAVPFVAGIAITGIVGWLLMFSGVMHLIFAWRSSTTSTAIWEVLLGIAYGAIGFYLLTRPVVGLASLTIALGVYLFVEAIIEFALSLQFRGHGGSGWLLFDGVVTLILGIMIAASWPASTVWAIGTIVGISMLFSGISRLMLSIALQRRTA
jgi:uncharacterized membrane protein HdeD (DUF308 family)